MINHSNVIFSYFFFTFRPTDSLQGYHEKRLLNHLLNNYNLLERPVANESDALQVRFGLTLQQIIDVVSFPPQQISKVTFFFCFNLLSLSLKTLLLFFSFLFLTKSRWWKSFFVMFFLSQHTNHKSRQPALT